MPDSRDNTPMSRCAPAGMGTYLLSIDDGKVEEKVYPGGSSRARPAQYPQGAMVESGVRMS